MTTASVVLALVMGCDPVVADSGDDNGDRDDDVDDAGDDDQASSEVGDPDENPGDEDPEPEPEPAVLHAYAIRHGDLPPVDVGESDSGGSGGGGDDGIDPDAWLVTITTGADNCDDPWAVQACGQWSVRFTLPPDAAAGQYELFVDLNGFGTVSGPADELGDCWFGGGSLSGVLTLTAIDGSTIAGELSEADAIDFDPNGAFSAVVCP
jgi:hypothetical protein